MTGTGGGDGQNWVIRDTTGTGGGDGQSLVMRLCGSLFFFFFFFGDYPFDSSPASMGRYVIVVF
jgi:hypothetical protein